MYYGVFYINDVKIFASYCRTYSVLHGYRSHDIPLFMWGGGGGLARSAEQKKNHELCMCARRVFATKHDHALQLVAVHKMFCASCGGCVCAHLPEIF